MDPNWSIFEWGILERDHVNYAFAILVLRSGASILDPRTIFAEPDDDDECCGRILLVKLISIPLQ